MSLSLGRLFKYPPCRVPRFAQNHAAKYLVWCPNISGTPCSSCSIVLSHNSATFAVRPLSSACVWVARVKVSCDGRQPQAGQPTGWNGSTRQLVQPAQFARLQTTAPQVHLVTPTPSLGTIFACVDPHARAQTQRGHEAIAQGEGASAENTQKLNELAASLSDFDPVGSPQSEGSAHAGAAALAGAEPLEGLSVGGKSLPQPTAV